MNSRTEKKVKKFENIKVWPSVVWAIIAFAVLINLVYFSIVMYTFSITIIRFKDYLQRIQRVEQVMDTESISDLIANYDSVQKLVPEVRNVIFYDENMKVLRSCNNYIPLLDEYQPVSDLQLGYDLEKVYFPNETMKYISSGENGGISLETFSIWKYYYKTLLSVPPHPVSTNHYADEELVGMTLLLTYPSENSLYYVGVLCRYSLYVSDIMFVMALGMSTCVIIFILMLYHICSTVRLVKNRRIANEILYMDMVTGGKNERYFYKQSEKLIQSRGKRGLFGRKKESEENRYAIVSYRMEKIKEIVSSYGIDAGEELINRVYSILLKEMKKKELVCRLDNADFGLLINFKNEIEVNQRLEDISINMLSINNPQKLSFTVGVCEVTDSSKTTRAIYNNAAIARALNRVEGLCNIKWFTDHLEAEQRWERHVEDEMDFAIKNKQFVVYLQPKYYTGEERVGGAEALVRWIHPIHGLIPPNRFIPIFEKNGFITVLDDYMISEVAKQQRRWITEGKEIVPISVNVSRAHFMQNDLAEHIRDIVDSYGVPHEAIEVELTESAFFDDKEMLIETVEKMRSYGFPVSIDDFGSGYSSLNSLKDIPLDVLKIDGGFFRGIENDERGHIVIKETIDLAKQLGLHTVAEGVETREQVELLKRSNCDLIQGFYYAKPMPIDEYEKLIYKQE